MENPEILSADVKAHLAVVKKNGVYDLTFTCLGSLHIPCDRCLDPMEHTVDTTYHITVQYGDRYDDVSDDLLVIPMSDTYLNVAYMLYDTILLTIPMRHVHPAGQCNRAMAAVLARHRGPAAIADDAADAQQESDDDGDGNDD